MGLMCFSRSSMSCLGGARAGGGRCGGRACMEDCKKWMENVEKEEERRGVKEEGVVMKKKGGGEGRRW